MPFERETKYLIPKPILNAARYTFSASSSVVISELLKFLLSTTFFYREVLKRHHSSGQSYHAVRPPSEARESLEKERASLSDDFDYHAGSTVEAGLEGRSADVPQHPQLNFTPFVRSCLAEVPLETKYGFAQLALLYALINNIVRYTSNKLHLQLLYLRIWLDLRGLQTRRSWDDQPDQVRHYSYHCACTILRA